MKEPFSESRNIISYVSVHREAKQTYSSIWVGQKLVPSILNYRISSSLSGTFDIHLQPF